MGLFGKKEGGMMDIIRCDEQEYLIWKWRPSGEANSTKRENAIRYGSSLRVKDGEVAVFVYSHKDGAMQDFILGPYDKKLETANFPVLAKLVGIAWGGKSPFQAEVYFINLARLVQVKFGVPYFDVYDPRFLDIGVPIAVRGTLSFNVADYEAFIKLHRLIDFDLETFKLQIRDAVVKRVKGIVSNIPAEYKIPVIQLERKIMEISQLLYNHLSKELLEIFGVNVVSVDVSAVEPDKESDEWVKLRKMTINQQERIVEKQTEVSLRNLDESQRISSENIAETLKIQREEVQRAQRLQTEQSHIGAHSLNLQTDVLKVAAENIGTMGNINLGGGEGNMNPAGVMTGMMMGGAMGQQMATLVTGMGQQVQQQMQQMGNTPPPLPCVAYYIAIDGAQSGPYSLNQLQQMTVNGQLTSQTYVWKPGMSAWDIAGNLSELIVLFPPKDSECVPPPLPTK